jgi:hypothetical protein
VLDTRGLLDQIGVFVEAKNDGADRLDTVRILGKLSLTLVSFDLVGSKRSKDKRRLYFLFYFHST